MGNYYLYVATSFLLLLRISFGELQSNDPIDDITPSIEPISSSRSEVWPHEMCNKTIGENEPWSRSEGIKHINYDVKTYVFEYK